jgi:hypothetical protein
MLCITDFACQSSNIGNGNGVNCGPGSGGCGGPATNNNIGNGNTGPNNIGNGNTGCNNLGNLRTSFSGCVNPGGGG